MADILSIIIKVVIGTIIVALFGLIGFGVYLTCKATYVFLIKPIKELF